MKILYLDCSMGAAGDMLAAALYELCPDQAGFLQTLNSAGIPGLAAHAERDGRGGVSGCRFRVRIDGAEEEAAVPEPGHENHDHGPEHQHENRHEQHHEHHHEHGHSHAHSTLTDIRTLIAGLRLPQQVKDDIAAVYGLIAEAESAVHGEPVEQVHFHEVGALDAVADMVGVCALMEEIAPERVAVSPVHVGCGQVNCAHGTLPVPAPATALILEGVPIYGGEIRGELCTPTGAALLRHFADEFGAMPPMAVSRVGYGMGTKDFRWANCVRVMLGESEPEIGDAAELCCNLDDMTGEEIAFAAERLREAGALDVWTQPIQMKKGRPGTLLACLCDPGREREFAALMLKHTATLGVRCRALRRYTLEREAVTLDTPYGPVRAKRSSGYGVTRVKPEFDDLAGIARREGLPVRDVQTTPRRD